jgi:hypothetical protein
MAFTIDRVRRITAYAASNKVAKDNHGVEINIGDILYTLKDVSNFSISNSAETVDAVDGLGNVIDTYLRSKTAEMSGENAIFDFPLAAAMAGTRVSTDSVDIDFHDVLTVKKDETEVSLSKSPKATDGEPEVIYVLNNDGTLGEKLEVGAGKAATYTAETVKTVVVTPAQGEEGNENYVPAVTKEEKVPAKITLATKFVDGDGNSVAKNIFVPYTYTEANATKFENYADAATIPSRIVVEGLGRDVCDHHQVYFYITAPYAELSYDGEFGFATDSTYNFTLNCKKPYCSEDGLYAVIVVDAE